MEDIDDMKDEGRFEREQLDDLHDSEQEKLRTIETLLSLRRDILTLTAALSETHAAVGCAWLATHAALDIRGDSAALAVSLHQIEQHLHYAHDRLLLLLAPAQLHARETGLIPSSEFRERAFP